MICDNELNTLCWLQDAGFDNIKHYYIHEILKLYFTKIINIKIIYCIRHGWGLCQYDDISPFLKMALFIASLHF